MKGRNTPPTKMPVTSYPATHNDIFHRDIFPFTPVECKNQLFLQMSKNRCLKCSGKSSLAWDIKSLDASLIPEIYVHIRMEAGKRERQLSWERFRECWGIYNIGIRIFVDKLFKGCPRSQRLPLQPHQPSDPIYATTYSFICCCGQNLELCVGRRE